MENAKNINGKKVSGKGKITKRKNNEKKRNAIAVIDYVFLISLALSVLFGIQTNTIFMWPFTISLIVTIICVTIILINAIYVKIFKKIRKARERNKSKKN